MAGLILNFNTPIISLGANHETTVLQIVAPERQMIKLLVVGIYYKGTSASAKPVQGRVVRQSDDGEGLWTQLFPAKANPYITITPRTTGFYLSTTGTDEPTEDADDPEIKRVQTHPQTGYEYVSSFALEDWLVASSIVDTDNKGNSRAGVQLLAEAAVDVSVHLKMEE